MTIRITMHAAGDSAAESNTHDEASTKALLRFLSVPAFTLLTAAFAQIAVPTEPLGVPISLQTLAVLLAAMALGPRLGAASMLLYLVVGAIGVGVFAEGEAGIATILGQSGGYLVGFVICQPVAHAIIRDPNGAVRGWIALVVAGIAVHAVVFLIGVPWLYLVRRLDPGASTLTAWEAIYYGMIVFLPGMVIKCALATIIGRWMLPSVASKLW